MRFLGLAVAVVVLAVVALVMRETFVEFVTTFETLKDGTR